MSARDTAGQRTDRQVGWLISLGGVALVVGHAVPAASRDNDFAQWWNILGGLLLLVVLTFAAVGLVLPFRLLRLGWMVAPLTGAFLLLTSFAAHYGPIEADALPWVWSFEAALVSYLVLLVRPWLAAVATVASACLPALSAVLFLGHVPAGVATATPIHVANIIYIAIFAGIRVRLNGLRTAEARARDEESRRMRAAVEAEQHERLALLIHDEVLSVLNAAMTFRGAPPAALRDEAAHALAVLDGPVPPAADDQVDTDEAAGLLDATLRRIDHECVIQSTVTPGQVPRMVLDVIGASAAEALRNSVRHARQAMHASLIRVEPGFVEVIVRDSGPGFDPTRIPDHALGLTESIKGRMGSLPGGTVLVETAPGAGTQVRLTWRT